MRIKFKCIAALLVIATTMNVAQAGYKYHYTAMKRYFPQPSATYFMVQDPHLNPAGCVNPAYYGIAKDHPSYEEYQKLLLSSKISGYKIGVYVLDNECLGSYPKVHLLFIQ